MPDLAIETDAAGSRRRLQFIGVWAGLSIAYLLLRTPLQKIDFMLFGLIGLLVMWGAATVMLVVAIVWWARRPSRATSLPLLLVVLMGAGICFQGYHLTRLGTWVWFQFQRSGFDAAVAARGAREGRVSFDIVSGFDNGAGIVYDPSGQVATVGGRDAKTDPVSEKPTMLREAEFLFPGVITGCYSLGRPYYMCSWS